MKKVSKTEPVSTLCPHLGLRDDPGTAFAYPNLTNTCFKCRPPHTPRLEHQSAACLAAAHTQCPVYQQPAEGAFFPAELAWAGSRARQTRRFPLWGWAAVGLGLLLAGVSGWLLFRPVASAPVPSPVVGEPALLATPSLKPPKVGVTSPPPTLTPIPPTATETATPTLTPLPPQVHTLDQPVIVNGQAFVMHRIIDGEQLAILTKRYQTSVEVLNAINFYPPVPVWAGRVLVLAPGLLELPTIMPLDPYEVTEATRLEDLAASLAVDPQLMLTYNGCNPGCELAPGDWVMVPRPWPTPTP